MDLLYDVNTKQLHINADRVVRLLPQEEKFILELVKNQGSLTKRENVMRATVGNTNKKSINTLQVVKSNLLKKVPELDIQVVRYEGYILKSNILVTENDKQKYVEREVIDKYTELLIKKMYAIETTHADRHDVLNLIEKMNKEMYK